MNESLELRVIVPPKHRTPGKAPYIKETPGMSVEQSVDIKSFPLQNKLFIRTSTWDSQLSPRSPTKYKPILIIDSPQESTKTTVKQTMILQFLVPLVFLGVWMVQVVFLIFLFLIGLQLSFASNPLDPIRDLIYQKILKSDAVSFFTDKEATMWANVINRLSRKHEAAYWKLGYTNMTSASIVLCVQVYGFLVFYAQKYCHILFYACLNTTHMLILWFIIGSLYQFDETLTGILLRDLFQKSKDNCSICSSALDSLNKPFTHLDDVVLTQSCLLGCCGLTSNEDVFDHLTFAYKFPISCCKNGENFDNITAAVGSLCNKEKTNKMFCTNEINMKPDCLTLVKGTDAFYFLSIFNLQIMNFYLLIIGIEALMSLFLIVLIVKNWRNILHKFSDSNDKSKSSEK